MRGALLGFTPEVVIAGDSRRAVMLGVEVVASLRLEHRPREPQILEFVQPTGDGAVRDHLERHGGRRSGSCCALSPAPGRAGLNSFGPCVARRDVYNWPCRGGVVERFRRLLHGRASNSSGQARAMEGPRRLLLLVVAGIVCAGAVAGLVATAWPVSSKPAGEPRVTVNVYVLPQVMTCAYKVYGGSFSDIYLARCTIKNTGTAPVTNFQITYKIPGYVEDTSSQDYPVILPGQTVRDYCWPNFDPKQMRLIQSDTRAELHITYTWDGLERPRRESEKFTLLGHNSYVYTYLSYEDRMGFRDLNDNARYLATFVTYQDPKVQRLAKRLTRNVAAKLSDDDAWLAAKRVFYGLQALPMKYITEHFDPSEGIQYIQFPRDTIMNRAGTCIDTAILFSALLEAVGIKTYLIGLSGHCIPAFEMPESEDVYFVESTLLRQPGIGFVDACNSAYDTYQENKKEGTYVWVDVEEAWAEGFVPSW